VLLGLGDKLLALLETVPGLVGIPLGLGDTLCLGDTLLCLGDTLPCLGDMLPCLGDTLLCLGDQLLCLGDQLLDLDELSPGLVRFELCFGESLLCLAAARLLGLGERPPGRGEGLLDTREMLLALLVYGEWLLDRPGYE
jgi:hypothetical protein